MKAVSATTGGGTRSREAGAVGEIETEETGATARDLEAETEIGTGTEAELEIKTETGIDATVTRDREPPMQQKEDPEEVHRINLVDGMPLVAWDRCSGRRRQLDEMASIEG